MAVNLGFAHSNPTELGTGFQIYCSSPSSAPLQSTLKPISRDRQQAGGELPVSYFGELLQPYYFHK